MSVRDVTNDSMVSRLSTVWTSHDYIQLETAVWSYDSRFIQWCNKLSWRGGLGLIEAAAVGHIINRYQCDTEPLFGKHQRLQSKERKWSVVSQHSSIYSIRYNDNESRPLSTKKSSFYSLFSQTDDSRSSPTKYSPLHLSPVHTPIHNNTHARNKPPD